MKGIDELRESMRVGVLELQDSAFAEIRQVLAGKKPISDVTKLASATVQRMIRVDDTARMERENSASLSLRFIKLLDGDDALRAEYVALTAPRLPTPIKSLSAPKGKKK